MEAQTTSQNAALTPGQEGFIARQLDGLRDLGLPDSALAREEALLRGGFATTNVITGLFEHITAGIK